MGRPAGVEERAWRAARAVAVVTIPLCAVAILALGPALGLLRTAVTVVVAPSVPLGVMVGTERALRRAWSARSTAPSESANTSATPAQAVAD